MLPRSRPLRPAPDTVPRAPAPAAPRRPRPPPQPRRPAAWRTSRRHRADRGIDSGRRSHRARAARPRLGDRRRLPSPARVSASVIIPTRNRGALVLEAVRSALDADGVDEVIVVDGGSTDGSLESLRDFGDQIRLVEGSFPNAAATRNAGAAQARGAFLGFLDSDDLMRAGKIHCLAKALEGHNDVCLAHGQTTVIDADGRHVDAATTEQDRQLAEGERRGTTYRALADYCAMYTSATLIRRAAFEAVGGYDESLETD